MQQLRLDFNYAEEKKMIGRGEKSDSHVIGCQLIPEFSLNYWGLTAGRDF